MAKIGEVYVDNEPSGYGAVRVVGIKTIIEFCPEGGGFVTRVDEAEFNSSFKLRVEPPPFKAIKVEADWDDNDPEPLVFDAYSDGVPWNGWAKPYFTKEVGLTLKVDRVCPEIEFDEAQDAFILPEPGGDDEATAQVCKGEDIVVDGQTLHLYRIGDGWCWNLAEEQPGASPTPTPTSTPQTMTPPWTAEHSAAAQAEGWDVFECIGSSHGQWQIQKVDADNKLDCDDAAWRIVATRAKPHHVAAVAFIKAHNPQEIHAFRDLFRGDPA